MHSIEPPPLLLPGVHVNIETALNRPDTIVPVAAGLVKEKAVMAFAVESGVVPPPPLQATNNIAVKRIGIKMLNSRFIVVSSIVVLSTNVLRSSTQHLKNIPYC
jgi:hypothetical protein